MPIFKHLVGTPGENLSAFVISGRRKAKQNGLKFDDDYWDVSRLLRPSHGRPRSGHRRFLNFSTNVGGSGEQHLIPKNMAHVAKAYCAHFLGRTAISGLTDRLDAFCHLGSHLAGRSIIASTVATFDSAVKTVKACYSPDAARNRAYQLQSIARFLDEHGMVRSDLANWSHGCTGSLPPAGTSGPEFDANATARLPTPDFLNAIAKSFALATKPADVLVTGSCTLLRCFPGRISAILNIEENPDVEHQDDQGVKRLLVRYPAEKRMGPSVKWVSKEMTPIAKIALDRMHHVTADPRAAKRWYDKHLDKLYLPENLKHLRRRKFLMQTEAAVLLGISPDYFQIYAAKNKLKMSRLSNGQLAITFAVVEQHVLTHLDAMMYRAGGRNYHPLMLLKWGALQSSTGGSPCLFEPLDYSVVRTYLMPPVGEAGLFERLGVAKRGKITGTSHSFRHDLGTNGVRGGLSEEDLAEWFGRTDPRWAMYYDHTTNADFNEVLSSIPKIFFGRT